MKKIIAVCIIVFCCSIACAKKRNPSLDNQLVFEVKNRNFNKVKELIENGADVNATDTSGNKIILLSSKEILIYLINNGADVNARQQDGPFKSKTVLMLAVEYNEIEIVKLLLSKYADVDAIMTDGYFQGASALILLAMGRKPNIEIATILLNKNAYIDAADSNGTNALMWAALNGSIELVKLLISKRANLKARNNEGETALQIAIKKNYHAIVKILRQAGATE